MESNLTGTLNAGLCLVTVLALFLYRRNGARYKPGIAWLSYLLCWAMRWFRSVFWPDITRLHPGLWC